MKEICGEKRLDVACGYLLGRSYAEIEGTTGASHGTVANIVRELESGKLVIPGTSSEQVNDLRTLALDIKKRGMQPSQALLGLTLFQKLQALEITPERLDGWSALLAEFAQPDFSPKDFLEVAMTLHDLEKSQGKPFGILAEESAILLEDVAELKTEVESLRKVKADHASAVKVLESQLQSAAKTRSDLEADVKKETTRLQEIRLQLKDAEKAKTQLIEETKKLEKEKARLSAEVDGKEESLKKLNDIGLSDEDLLRLRAFVENTSKNEGITGDRLRERFFLALALYEDVSALEKRRKTETDALNELTNNQSVLTGEILQLEKRKADLEGEMSESISEISQKVKDVGERAATQLEQQVAHIREQLDGVLKDTLKAGMAVGEMRQSVRKGEESATSLENFVRDVRARVPGKNGGG